MNAEQIAKKIVGSLSDRDQYSTSIKKIIDSLERCEKIFNSYMFSYARGYSKLGGRFGKLKERIGLINNPEKYSDVLDLLLKFVDNRHWYVDGLSHVFFKELVAEFFDKEKMPENISKILAEKSGDLYTVKEEFRHAILSSYNRQPMAYEQDEQIVTRPEIISTSAVNRGAVEDDSKTENTITFLYNLLSGELFADLLEEVDFDLENTSQASDLEALKEASEFGLSL